MVLGVLLVAKCFVSGFGLVLRPCDGGVVFCLCVGVLVFFLLVWSCLAVGVGLVPVCGCFVFVVRDGCGCCLTSSGMTLCFMYVTVCGAFG